MDYIQYILISTICLSLFYTVYLFVFKHDTNFKWRRFYLLTSIVISVSLPFSKYQIQTDYSRYRNVIKTQPLILPDGANIEFPDIKNNVIKSLPVAKKTEPIQFRTDILPILTKLYLFIFILLLLRITIQILTMIFWFLKSAKEKQGRFIIVTNRHYEHTFSFFKLIFVNKGYAGDENSEQIILHEKIHASQYHSIDLILVELIAAVMWFNPLVWMMKRSMILVHEYLADEGALRTGIDRLSYQALLINQVSEEKLICVSSNFSSLIKKRMIMIKKNNPKQKSKLHYLTLFPLTIAIFIAIGLIKGVFVEPVKAEEKTVLQKANSSKEKVNEIIFSGDTIKRTNKMPDGKNAVHLVLSENTQKDTIRVIGYGQNDTTKNMLIAVNQNKGIKTDAKLVYVVDGVYVDNIYNLSPDSIASINVLKEDNLMVIRTKGYIKPKPSIAFNNLNGKISKTIIFIDGIEQPEYKTIESIDASTIESIEVFKDKAFIRSKTEKECDAAILIKTRKK